MRGVLLGALLATAVLVMAIVDQDSGFRTWLHLRQDLAQAQARVGQLQAEVTGLERQVLAMRQDPFAEERAIREVLGLARPGEVVVRFRDEEHFGAAAPSSPVPQPTRSRR